MAMGRIKDVGPASRLVRKKTVQEQFERKREALKQLAEFAHPRGRRLPHKAATRLIKKKETKAVLAQRQLGPRTPRCTPLPTHLIEPPNGVVEMEDTAIASIAEPSAEQLNSDAIEAIRDRVRRICEAGNGYSQARIAKEVQISTATLSQFLGGNYQGNVLSIALKVRQWLDLLAERQNNEELPAVPRWVDTPTSRRILNDLRYAHLARDLILIVGGAGIGKTKAIEQYASITPCVWHVEMTAATGSLVAALEEIAIVVGEREYARSGPYLQRAIAKRIRNTGGLLVIDEAQHLTVQALDQIRWFNDSCNIGLVLSGNDRVYTQLTGGNRAAYLDRLYSRVGKKTHIKRVGAGDADAIIKAWGIDDSATRDNIRDIASRPGALRVLNKVLRLAATYAQAKGKRISMDEISAAARELGVFE